MLCPVVWCSNNGAVLVAQAAVPLTQGEMNHFFATGGFQNWDYLPWDAEPDQFEWKASDWGWLDGKLVALDYSTPALTTAEELEELIAGRSA